MAGVEGDDAQGELGAGQRVVGDELDHLLDLRGHRLHRRLSRGRHAAALDEGEGHP